MVSNSVSAVPELDEARDNALQYTPTKEEEERGRRRFNRIDQMLKAREPYEPGMVRGMLLYDGISILDPRKRQKLKNDNVVAPFASIFVEAKTAEEVRSSSEYEFIPVEKEEDQPKVKLLKEVNEQVRRVIGVKWKRHQMFRMKNMSGVSIGRVGYRRIMGLRKIKTVSDEHGDATEWKEVEVPIYDDIFMDVVSPLNFAVDPNARSMNDAMDCVHWHSENYEVFYETYANDPKFKNTDAVLPGSHGFFESERYTEGHFRGKPAEENMVMITEYFNKIRDEWIIWANGVEIYYGPLPDAHKKLPFFSYHNSPSFINNVVEEMVTGRDSTGAELVPESSVIPEETFWTIGDPQKIHDLIDLRTGFGRAAYRAIKLAGESLVLTAPNFVIPRNRPWRTGDPIIGGLGKVDTKSLGDRANISGFQFAFDDLFNLMILVTGVDPRALSDSKTKTATQAAIERQTSMRRLEQGIEFNEENGETLFGEIVFKLIQERYTKPEIVRITGEEDEETIKSFDEIEKDLSTGINIYGKRYRRIRTSFKIDQSVKGRLGGNGFGVNSFLAKPEYIRTAGVDVQVISKKSASSIKAVQAEQALQGIQMTSNLLPMTQKNPLTGESLINAEDLPSLKKLSEMYMEGIGLSESVTEKKDDPGKIQKEAKDILSVAKARPPITNTFQQSVDEVG